MQNVHGGDIYSRKYELDFSANINPLGMPQSVVKAACEGVRLSVNYPDPQCRQLRGAIAQADGTEADEVICGNGAAELIFALCLARRPKRALLVAPGFAEYAQALEAAGCQIEYYYARAENDFRVENTPDHKTDLSSSEYFLNRITPQIDMLFLCNPNNPTGALMSRPFLEQVLQKCITTGTLMVLDECFIGFLEDGRERTMVRVLEKTGKIFILRAFTKLYAMPGLRLGYGLCSDRELLEQMHSVCQPWNVSIPAQMAGVAALKETEFARRSLEVVTREKHYLEQELTQMGMRCFPPAANYVFFRYPKEAASETASDRKTSADASKEHGDAQRIRNGAGSSRARSLAQACADRGILIRDCSNYVGLEKGYYRVAVRKHEENVRLIEVLKDILS